LPKKPSKDQDCFKSFSCFSAEKEFEILKIKKNKNNENFNK
jgi:hypothetical protein